MDNIPRHIKAYMVLLALLVVLAAVMDCVPQEAVCN